MACLATATYRSAGASATIRSATASSTLRAADATATIRCVSLHDGTLLTSQAEPVLTFDGDLISVETP